MVEKIIMERYLLELLREGSVGMIFEWETRDGPGINLVQVIQIG